jgi:protein ImuB
VPAPRIACVLVPLFPLAARLRSEPELAGEALAIFSGSGNAARVAAASRAARKAGVRPGLSLTQARALQPKLLARGRDSECERSAQEALLEAAERFSPRVEEEGPGAVFLDVEGLERHFPGESPERALGQSLIAAVEAAGMPSRAGIAGSKLAARVAAEAPHSPVVVPPGGEAEFLAPLPLARLSPPPEIAEVLDRWGFTAIGDLARLPEGEVESRLGEAGRGLSRAARGFDPRPLLPRPAPPSFDEGMDLEWPLVALEPFLFVARAALDRLAQRLCAQALACSRLELTLKLDPEGVDARSLALPAPTRDVKTLLTLVRLELEKKMPGAPVIGFHFAAHPDRPRRAQLSLFGPVEISPEKLATVLAKLAAWLGEDRVGRPVPADSRLPERFAASPYAPPPPPTMPKAAAGGRGLLAVRTLRPPVPLDVVLEETEERPAASGEKAEQLCPGSKILGRSAAPEIRGTVRVASGPWRLEEEWWLSSGAQRDYWDVELSDGGLYRLFRDRKSGEWLADGIYD